MGGQGSGQKETTSRSGLMSGLITGVAGMESRCTIGRLSRLSLKRCRGGSASLSLFRALSLPLPRLSLERPPGSSPPVARMDPYLRALSSCASREVEQARENVWAFFFPYVSGRQKELGRGPHHHITFHLKRARERAAPPHHISSKKSSGEGRTATSHFI